MSPALLKNLQSLPNGHGLCPLVWHSLPTVWPTFPSKWVSLCSPSSWHQPHQTTHCDAALVMKNKTMESSVQELTVRLQCYSLRAGRGAGGAVSGLSALESTSSSPQQSFKNTSDLRGPLLEFRQRERRQAGR